MHIAAVNGIVLLASIMQINATYLWLIQHSQLELTGTPEGCLISGCLHFLRERLGICVLPPPSHPSAISN